MACSRGMGSKQNVGMSLGVLRKSAEESEGKEGKRKWYYPLSPAGLWVRLQFDCPRHRFLALPEGRNGSDLSPSSVSSTSPRKTQPALTSLRLLSFQPQPIPTVLQPDHSPLHRSLMLTLLWAEHFSGDPETQQGGGAHRGRGVGRMALILFAWQPDSLCPPKPFSNVHEQGFLRSESRQDTVFWVRVCPQVALGGSQSAT